MEIRTKEDVRKKLRRWDDIKMFHDGEIIPLTMKQLYGLCNGEVIILTRKDEAIRLRIAHKVLKKLGRE